MSWIAALSIGSIVQNIALYIFLSFLVYANYCLIEANSDKKRYIPVIPENNSVRTGSI
jgi:hypothetical protein